MQNTSLLCWNLSKLGWTACSYFEARLWTVNRTRAERETQTRYTEGFFFVKSNTVFLELVGFQISNPVLALNVGPYLNRFRVYSKGIMRLFVSYLDSRTFESYQDN